MLRGVDISAIKPHENIEIDPTSLANWMIKCSQLVQPLINLAYEQLRADDLLFMDETVLQVLKEESRSASQQSRMCMK